MYFIEFLKNFFKEQKINSKSMKFADIGCGNGTLLYLLSQRLKYKQIVGFDYSRIILKENVKNFKKNKIKNFIFINSPAEKINKKFENYFDVIFVTWTLSSCSDPLYFIKNIYKLLKKMELLLWQKVREF